VEQSPGPNERGLLKFLDQLDQESHQAKEQLASASWERYLQIERGQDWPDRNKAPMWKANPIKTTVARKAALLTETKPHNRILPRRPGLEATATILEKAIDAGWEEYNLEQILEFNAKTMGVLGCGFLKLPYDRHADYGAGDVVPVAVDPRNVRIDPAVTQSHELANAQYLIVDSIEPVWSLWRKYPGRGALVTPDPRYSSLYSGPERPTGMWAWAASKLTTVVRPQPSTEPGAIPRAYIREYQFHDPTLNDDGTPRYPAGRFVIRAGDDVILEDRPNPYWDGGWDLEMVDTMPDLDHPWGTSEVEALRRIQEALNRVMDLFVRNRVATGNMRIEADHNALEPDTVGLLKSLNAVVLTKRFGTNLNVVMPENMPADMLQFADLSIKLMDYLSGLSEPTIDGRFEVRSGVQFEGLQAAQQTLVRATARRMENYLQRIGQKWISRIFQFYTNDRLMSYLGPGPTFQTFAFERQMLMRELVTKVRGELQRKAIEDSAAIPPDLLREEIERATRMAFRDFRFKVTPGSSLASTKLQRAMLFAQLAMNGVLSRTKVLEELGFASPEEEIERAMREAQVLGMPSQKGRKGQSA
jgi:hypothetical protein